MLRMTLFLMMSLLLVAEADAADTPPTADKKTESLEQKLSGEWRGGACVGELNLNADGTFQRRYYSPGGFHLAGKWELRKNMLPPSLLMTCQASDSDEYVGKTIEIKVLQLDDATFAYQFIGETSSARFERVPTNKTRQAKELAALQGTWKPLQLEEEGKQVAGELSTRHIVKGDTITVQVDDKTHAKGKVSLDPHKTPPQLDLRLENGETHLLIYVRAGDHIICCGNRDGQIRPTEFSTGTPRGGEYLMTWKIEK